MKNLLFFILCNTWSILSAQPGFNNYYSIDSASTSFFNGVVYQDTIYINASIKIPGGSQYVAMVRADTNGNIISAHPFFHPQGLSLAMGVNYTIKHLSNGKIGFLCDRGNTIFLLQYHRDGTLVSYKEIPYTVYSNIAYDFEEYLGGFLISGSLVDTTNRGNAFLTRTDAEGNVLWTKMYRPEPYDESGKCMIVLNNNTVAIGSTLTQFIFTPQSSSRSRITLVDSTGIIKREWRSEAGHNGVWNISQLDNGDWLFTDGNYYSIPPAAPYFEDTIRGYRSVVRADSNFNEIWRTKLSPTDWNPSRAHDLLPSPDGYWILSEHIAFGPYFYGSQVDAQGGCLTKITSDGDILWQTCDTLHWNPPVNSRDIPSGHVVLPSGSSILIGRSDVWQPPVARSFGWMFKVDASGCLQAPCTVGADEAVTEEKPGAYLYPNPASEILNVRLDEACTSDVALRVFDSQGRLMLQRTVPTGTTLVALPVADWPGGMYWVRAACGERFLFAEKVLIQR